MIKKRQNPAKKFVCAAALGLGMMYSQHAQAAPNYGDFDGDGLSDLVAVNVDRAANSTAFLIRNSSNPAIPGLYVFSSAGDAYVSGKFFDDSRYFPGIVRVVGLTSPLIWTIKDPNARDVNLSYGLPGDRIPNQGDLDCDGRTDLVTTRPGTAARYPGFRFWYVALTSGGIYETVFGLEGDRTAVADIDGDGCAEMVALREDFTWFSRKLYGDDKSIGAQQWGLAGDIPLVPQDLDGDGGADYVVVRGEGAGHIAYVRYSNGQGNKIPLGPVGTIPMIGNFFGSNTFGWQDRTHVATMVKTPEGTDFPVAFGATSTFYILRPDGTVIAPGDDGRLGAPPSSFNGGNGGAFAGCSRYINPVDGRSKNWTLNPNNSRDRVKLIAPASYNSGVSLVQLLDAGGNHVDDFYRATPNEHGNRPRWYTRNATPGGAPKNSIIIIHRNGQTECINVPDPSRRYD